MNYQYRRLRIYNYDKKTINCRFWGSAPLNDNQYSWYYSEGKNFGMTCEYYRDGVYAGQSKSISPSAPSRTLLTLIHGFHSRL